MSNFKRFILFCFLSLLFFGGCASPMKRVTDPTLRVERPTYSLLPPQGDGWFYAKQDQLGRFDLGFNKEPSSPTHTIGATVAEIHSYAQFEKPNDFFKYIKQSSKMDADPRRFEIIGEGFELNEKFGPYSILKHVSAKDYAAKNLNGAKYLVLRIYGYIFVHPFFPNLIISIDYSERGKPNELDADDDFIKTAQKFIDGLTLKNKKI